MKPYERGIERTIQCHTHSEYMTHTTEAPLLHITIAEASNQSSGAKESYARCTPPELCVKEMADETTSLKAASSPPHALTKTRLKPRT